MQKKICEEQDEKKKRTKKRGRASRSSFRISRQLTGKTSNSTTDLSEREKTARGSAHEGIGRGKQTEGTRNTYRGETARK